MAPARATHALEKPAEQKKMLLLMVESTNRRLGR
jgi:hypothetical protein